MGQHMHPKLAVFFAVILVCLGFVFWDQNRTPELIRISETTTQQASKSAPIPNIELNRLHKTAISLHDIKNKAIAIHFWATWCAPCLKEFPNLIKLAERHGETLSFIAISIDDDKDKIDMFLKRIGLALHTDLPENFIMTHDPKKHLAHDLFQSVKYPETFMLTPDYRIDKKIIGETDWLSPEMDRYISSLISAQ